MERKPILSTETLGSALEREGGVYVVRCQFCNIRLARAESRTLAVQIARDAVRQGGGWVDDEGYAACEDCGFERRG